MQIRYCIFVVSWKVELVKFKDYKEYKSQLLFLCFSPPLFEWFLKKKNTCDVAIILNSHLDPVIDIITDPPQSKCVSGQAFKLATRNWVPWDFCG